MLLSDLDHPSTSDKSKAKNALVALLLLVSTLLTYSPFSSAGHGDEAPISSGAKASASSNSGASASSSAAARSSAPSRIPYAEIDAAATKGRVSLKQWQDQVDPSAAEFHKSMPWISSKDPKFPIEIKINGEPAYKLLRKVGQGKNVDAYLTDRNTILKVIRDPVNSRKQLLLAWSSRVMKSYDIEAAEIKYVHPTGILLEQEYIPSSTLEEIYSSRYREVSKVPESIRTQLLEHWKKAKKLRKDRDFWLDIKSANYCVRPNGQIVNVDYVPRMNSTYFRFFGKDPNDTFTDEKFVDMFFNYDLNKGGIMPFSPSAVLEQLKPKEEHNPRVSDRNEKDLPSRTESRSASPETIQSTSKSAH